MLCSHLMTNFCFFFLVILESKDHPRFDKGFDRALHNSLAYVNTYVLRHTFIKLVVEKVIVDPHGIFQNGR